MFCPGKSSYLAIQKFSDIALYEVTLAKPTKTINEELEEDLDDDDKPPEDIVKLIVIINQNL